MNFEVISLYQVDNIWTH